MNSVLRWANSSCRHVSAGHIVLAAACVTATSDLAAQTPLAGRVIDGSARSSVVAAIIAAAGRTATTDSSGWFSLDMPARDTVLVRVRRLGYAPLDTLVDLRTSESLRFVFSLVRVPLRLDTVSVMAPSDLPGTIVEFEERRMHGLGRYIGRDELRENDDRMLAEVLRSRMPGLGFAPRDGMLWLFNPSQQPPGALGGSRSGGGSAQLCYTNVYLDGMPIFRADDIRQKRREPPDFNALFTREYDAVEYYAHPSSVPVQYRAEGAVCGALLLWTRRK